MKKMTDAELVLFAKGCCGDSPRPLCDRCPFDVSTDGCVARLISKLACRLEVQSDRCARYVEEISVLQERLREVAQ